MESDSFLWQLLKELPETLFELVGRPITEAAAYRFDSVEIKKSYRLDGVMVPLKPNLPVYFIEVQFRRVRPFYANLFAKVFTYLEMNEPNQDWLAVAIFVNRSAEPKEQTPYRDLLASARVRRIYLDELKVVDAATAGLKLLQLVTAPQSRTPALVSKLLHPTRAKADCEKADSIVRLVEEVLLRRFTQMDREEIRRMFQLHDLRESRVWQEAHQEGVEKGIEKGIEKGRKEGKSLAQQEIVHRWLTKGKSHKEIAELLEMPMAEVRRLASRL